MKPPAAPPAAPHVVPTAPVLCVLSLIALVLATVPAGPAAAQSTAPAASTPVPWQARPVIIVDPRAYLPSPSPRPRRPAASHRAAAVPGRALPHAHATPAHRRPQNGPTPETFERHDTAPAPTPLRAP